MDEGSIKLLKCFKMKLYISIQVLQLGQADYGIRRETESFKQSPL